PTEGDGGGRNRLSGYLSGPLLDNKLLGSVIVDGGKRDAWRTNQSRNPNSDALEARDTFNALTNLTWLIDDRQNIEFDTTYAKDDRDVLWNNNGASPRNIQKMERIGFGLTHNGSWEYIDTRLRYYFESVDLMDNSQLNGGKAYITQDNKTLDGQVSGYLGDHLITAGGEYRNTELQHSLNLQNGNVAVSQKAFFLQDEFKLGDLA
ncbi:TonB-dependent receptor, partial [Candidatus Symbiopectobacterium sp. NZEC135]|nr:TonB-dependent receptor [Candidatus Symbiopectobacterium sp. NZEC135]